MLDRSILIQWRKRPALILARAVFAAAFLFIAFEALTPNPPPTGLPMWDKVQHALAFYALTLLAAFAWPAARLVTLALALLAFGAAIEVLQAIPGLGREADLRDLAADLFGIALAAAALCAAHLRRLI